MGKKRMLHHLGFVAWGGCGFMGPTMGKIEGVLPNAGVGLRIEVQPLVNVRLVSDVILPMTKVCSISI